MWDIVTELDRDARRYLLTAKTERGQEFLDEYATASSEFWGKSLIVKYQEVDSVVDEVISKGLEIYFKGESK